MFYICCAVLFVLVVFFKQKTAYEMRISDWSSDVCSSDLRIHLCGIGDTQHGIMRGVKALLRELRRVRANEGNIALVGKRDQVFLGCILFGLSGAGYLYVEPVAEECLELIAVPPRLLPTVVRIEPRRPAFVSAGAADQ